MSREDEHEAHIRGLLERAGFTVERIDEADEERADYRLIRGDERYVLEVKSRLDDAERVQAHNQRLDETGYGEWVERVEPKRAISELLRKAVRQIDSVARTDELRITWLSALGGERGLQFDLFYATIYGRVDMIVPPRANGTTLVPCYYFDESAFFRHRTQLDAVAIFDGRRARLCINDLGPSAERVRRCSLRDFFEPGVLDPTADERDGDAYIADCAFDRRKQTSDVLDYVRAKYNQPRTIPFRPTSHSMTMLA